MKLYIHILALPLLLLGTNLSIAADQNGYTARYEKQIGTPPTCSIVINGANDSNWAKLNDPSYRVVCLAPGDYTSRGEIRLTASGSAGQERWLRYYSPQDNGNHPYNQAASDRVKLRNIVLDTANHWIIHRLYINPEFAGNTAGIFTNQSYNGGVSNVVIDKVFIERTDMNGIWFYTMDSNNTVQNSLIRDCRVTPNQDWNGVGLFGGPRNISIVNNEIYGCTHGILVNKANGSGHTIENNDVYISNSQFTDCRGNYTNDPNAPCANAESQIALKSGGSGPDGVVQIIHNRVWGARVSDISICCGSGQQGESIHFTAEGPNDPNTGARWSIALNNIVADGQKGIANYWDQTHNNTIMGNLIYNIRQYNSGVPSMALETSMMHHTEFYLNTVINSDRWFATAGTTDNDVLCNVVINSGGLSGSVGTRTVVDNNAFYNTAPYGSAVSNIIYPSAADAKADQFCYWRKLITGPEQVCVADAKPTRASPHYAGCKAAVGSRSGIGISDAPLL